MNGDDEVARAVGGGGQEEGVKALLVVVDLAKQPCLETPSPAECGVAEYPHGTEPILPGCPVLALKAMWTFGRQVRSVDEDEGSTDIAGGSFDGVKGTDLCILAGPPRR